MGTSETTNRFAMVPKYVLVGVALALGSASASKTVAGWSIPETWQVGSDYVVVGGASPSSYAGYIFPGPSPTSSKSVAYSSPGGYYCEAKNYDMNYGIFATQACANNWTKLITLGDEAGDATVANCKVVPTMPCGCQQMCRPVACTTAQIQATVTNGFEDSTTSCNMTAQCRRQEELGLVTSCATMATFQISMWFGIIFAVVVVFAAFAMMNMPLDMDSLLYTVGDPDKKEQ